MEDLSDIETQVDDTMNESYTELPLCAGLTGFAPPLLQRSLFDIFSRLRYSGFGLHHGLRRLHNTVLFSFHRLSYDHA